MVELKNRYPCQQAMLERAEIIGDVIYHTCPLAKIKRKRRITTYDPLFKEIRYISADLAQKEALHDICDECRYKNVVEEEGYEWLM